MITAAQPRYLTVTETARIIRLALKKQFPSIKFSVRSEKYSMGASIHISWNDGPRENEVKAITDGFEGASFDGMNDLQSYCDCWLLPDGTAQLAARPESYGGSIPGYVSDAPHPNAELVSFGSDYVFTARNISGWNAKHEAALNYIVTHCYCEHDKFGDEWVTTLANRMVQQADVNETLVETFQRVVIDRA